MPLNTRHWRALRCASAANEASLKTIAVLCVGVNLFASSVDKNNAAQIFVPSRLTPLSGAM
jgi:hypothetical protein